MIKKLAGKMTKKKTKTVSKAKSPSKTKTKTKKKISTEELYDLIAKKAYQIYVDRGFTHGDDHGDWFEAEKQVRAKYRT